jgi:hypothetical protein
MIWTEILCLHHLFIAAIAYALILNLNVAVTPVLALSETFLTQHKALVDEAVETPKTYIKLILRISFLPIFLLQKGMAVTIGLNGKIAFN